MFLGSRTRRWALAAGVAASAAAEPIARAEPDAAEVAFNKGLADMEAARYETACAALAESYRLDPKLGALYTQATCEERWGKLATALVHLEAFLEAVAQLPAEQRQKHREREHAAIAQKASLAARVPKLSLVLPASAPQGTRVSCDGKAIDGARLGVQIPVDPGEHRITTQNPGGPLQAQTVVLEPGESVRVVLSTAPVATPSPQRRAIMVASFGVGAVGLLVGAITGGLAAERKSVVDAHCSGRSCDAEGKAAADRGKALALASTVSFSLAVCGAAAGVVLFVTAPRAPGGARSSGAALHLNMAF